jgi:hypothetical protein
MFFSSETMNNTVFQRDSFSGDNPISMFTEAVIRSVNLLSEGLTAQ